jgi:hypothetical protein
MMMKYIEQLKQIENRKIILIAAGGLASCVLVAAMVYFGLRMVAPKLVNTGPSTSGETAPNSKERITKEADTLYQAGDAALKVGDTDKGITELKKALELYEQTDDVMKIEEIKDQISLAEYALKVEEGYKPTEAPKDKGKAPKAP